MNLTIDPPAVATKPAAESLDWSILVERLDHPNSWEHLGALALEGVEVSQGPITPEGAATIRQSLAEQASIPTAEGRLQAARAALDNRALPATAHYEEVVAMSRADLKMRDVRQTTALRQLRAPLTDLLCLVNSLRTNLSHLKAEFAQRMGESGLVCKDYTPGEVRDAVIRANGMEYLLKEELPATSETTEETPEEEEAPVIAVEPPPPADSSVEASQEERPKRSTLASRAFRGVENLFTGLVGIIVFGIFLSFTTGLFIGILEDTDLSSSRLSFKMLLAALLGPVILPHIGKIFDSTARKLARPPDRNSVTRPRVDLTMLWVVVCFLLWVAELTAGSHGMYTYHLQTEASLLRQNGAVAQVPESGGFPPLQYWIGALLVCTPYLFFKASKAYTEERDIYDQEETEAREREEQLKVQLRKEEENKAAHERKLETDRLAADTERQRLALARQEMLDEKQRLEDNRQRRLNDWQKIRADLTQNSVTRRLLELAQLICSTETDLAAAQAKLDELLAQKKELEQSKPVPDAMLERIRNAYLKAAEAASEVYKYSMGDLRNSI